MTTLDTRGRRRGPTAQAVFGLMVIVVGVLFTLDNLDILDARDQLDEHPRQHEQVGALPRPRAFRSARQLEQRCGSV